MFIFRKIPGLGWSVGIDCFLSICHNSICHVPRCVWPDISPVLWHTLAVYHHHDSVWPYRRLWWGKSSILQAVIVHIGTFGFKPKTHKTACYIISIVFDKVQTFCLRRFAWFSFKQTNCCDSVLMKTALFLKNSIFFLIYLDQKHLPWCFVGKQLIFL